MKQSLFFFVTSATRLSCKYRWMFKFHINMYVTCDTIYAMNHMFLFLLFNKISQVCTLLFSEPDTNIVHLKTRRCHRVHIYSYIG